MPSKLYLIPNQISSDQNHFYLPSEIAELRNFFVEEIKSSQRLLKKVDPQFPISSCTFFMLNEHEPAADIRKNFESCRDKDIGIIAEAGCPCVADPGADVVLLAHKEGREIIPCIGPSSILLALMSSGLNGQNFAFVGYLPKEKENRISRLKLLEKRSALEKQTQIFMEAPYRNEKLFLELLDYLDPQTLVCVASNLTASDQIIKTMPVKEWKKSKPALDKKPLLFLIQKI